MIFGEKSNKLETNGIVLLWGGGGSKREEKKRESENQRYMNVVLGVILKWGYWLVGGHKIKPDHGQFQC